MLPCSGRTSPVTISACRRSGRGFDHADNASSRRIAQSNDQVVETCEDCPWQQGLGHLERGVAAMAHQPGAGLDQPFVEAGERPVLDLLGRRQRPQEVRQIVGKSVKAETSGVCREAHAGEPRPFERILALLDVLLGCAPVVVEGQHPFIPDFSVRPDGA